MTVVMTPAPLHTAGPTGIARLLPARGGPSTHQPAQAWLEHLARVGPIGFDTTDRLAEILTAAGLLGRGGAGFPTGGKIAAVAANSTRRRPAVVVANCCEGDPTSAKDAVLLMNSPHLVVDGALLAAAAVGAHRVILAVHRGSPVADHLSRALAARGPAPVEVSIVAVPARFVASEATALVRYLNTGDARPAGRLSAIWESGVAGRPTLVDNAETLAQVALIARFGADWFRQVGVDNEPGTVLVTVGGAVRAPGVVEIAGGTQLQTILTAAGWEPPTGTNAPSWALIGGLAGRWIDLRAASGIGFTGAELARIGGMRGVSSIVVLPPGGCVLTETARILHYLADSGARQCGPCMFGLPAIAADMAALAGGDRDAMTRLGRRLPVIDKRGGCGHPDGAVGLAASALRRMTGEESAHLDVHLRHGGCNDPAAIVPLGDHRDGTGRSENR